MRISDWSSDVCSSDLIDADKLTAAIGSDGKSIPLEAAYEHSLQYAPSIADNTRASLSNGLAALAHSEYGQLVLASLPGLSSDSARKIGEAYETLGEDRKSTRLNSSHSCASRMPSCAGKNKTDGHHGACPH